MPPVGWLRIGYRSAANPRAAHARAWRRMVNPRRHTTVADVGRDRHAARPRPTGPSTDTRLPGIMPALIGGGAVEGLA